MALLLGIDTGGTFTDAVLFDDADGVKASAKALTTRHDLAAGIGAAVDAVLATGIAAPGDVALVSLSTTLATNALVEGQGGRVCLVLIGFDERILRRADLAAALGDDPVIFVAGGHDAHGEAAAELDLAALGQALGALDGEVSAFAVAAQFAVRNPSHETAARQLLRERTGRPVTCSHELSSQLDGPRRALTCLLNARLINLIHHLIAAARGLLAARSIAAPLMVVRGDGALISADVASERPIETILSGPAASLVGAAYLTGCRSALVADIGGTTTDFAVLEDGRPGLDPRGATVGGWRTMVEAVAMRTIGLGGDSELHTVADGLGLRIDLGPRRAVPVSLLALDAAEEVHEALDRQLAQPRPGDHDGRFAIAIRRDSAHLHALSGAEARLLEQLLAAPQPVDRIVTNRPQLTALNRLVARGLAQLSSFTPSDAAHVLALHEGWDGEAARKAATLFARRRTSHGAPLAGSAPAISTAVLSRLVEISAETLMQAACERDGIADPDLAVRMLAAARSDRPSGLVDLTLRLRVPLVGVGASAGTYYPRVAETLGTDAVVPEHAAVANAVGAVVGNVSATAERTITQPEAGRFRVHAPAGPRDFSSLDDAIAFANREASDAARSDAAGAGAGEIEVHVTRNQDTVMVDGTPSFIQALVTATASGRPRIA